MPEERDDDLYDEDEEQDESGDDAGDAREPKKERESWFGWGDDDEDEEREPRPPGEDKEGFWERRIGKRLDGLVPDMVKRALVGGLGPMFMSEDGLRQSLSELRLPKEAVNFIIQQADNTKKEFMRLVAKEMRDFLESTNFYDEIARVLTTLSFEIRTQIRLVPNDQMFVRPEVKNSVKVKREKGERKGEERDGDPWDDEEDQDRAREDDEERPKEKRRWGLGRRKDKDREKERDKDERKDRERDERSDEDRDGERDEDEE